MRIDAHQHFWRYDAGLYPWIDPRGPLARDHLPAEARNAMTKHGIFSCIAVQARQDETETDWLLSLADLDPGIAGVVGWTDLAGPELAARLERWTGAPLVGLRHMVQDEDDPQFFLQPEFLTGVRLAHSQALAYDILVREPQWPHLSAFADAVGGGALILDHAGKPDIAHGCWQPWADTIRDLARRPNVFCKLSGLVTEADHRLWVPSDMTQHLNYLLDCFGPERLMFGSDWPVCRLAADYARVTDLVEGWIDRACPAARDKVFGETAARAYRLEKLA